jgi:hypothetical protein
LGVVLGIPTVILAGFAAAIAFAQGPSIIVVIFATATALTRGLDEYLKPHIKAVQHHSAATELLELRIRLRDFLNLDLPDPTRSESELRKTYDSISSTRASILRCTPQVAHWAYIWARRSFREETEYTEEELVLTGD